MPEWYDIVTRPSRFPSDKYHGGTHPLDPRNSGTKSAMIPKYQSQARHRVKGSAIPHHIQPTVRSRAKKPEISRKKCNRRFD